MKSEDIRKIVDDIKASDVVDKEKHFGELYPDFKTNYPILFEKVCKNETENLDFMLKMLEQIHNNSKSQFDASAVVGQMLYSKYVEHKVKK